MDETDETIATDSADLLESNIAPHLRISETNDLTVLCTEIPPTKMVTDRDKDIWDTKALNFHMEPISKPSSSLDKYMETHLRRCEEQIEKMHSEMNEVHNRTENCIRTTCETLKNALKDVDDTIENWKTFVSSGKVPLTSIMMTKHNILNLTALRELLDKRRQAIDAFHEEIFVIENLRAKQSVDILRKHNVILSKTAVTKPAMIRVLLETEIMKINQVVLNNARYYEDLKLNFNLQGQTIERSFRDYIEKCQKKFTLKLLDTLQDRIQQLDPEKEFLDSQEGKSVLESLYSAQNLISELIKQQYGQVKYSWHDVELWTRNIQEAAEELDIIAKKVISVYKKNTYNLFQGQIAELEKVQDEYLSVNGNNLASTEKDTEMKELQTRVFHPVSLIEDKYRHNISDIEAQWKALMHEMQNTLRETFVFLRDSSQIWDRHFERTNEAKNIVNMKLLATIADQTVYEGSLEKDLNIAIDALRQAPNETSLDNELEKIFEMLESLELEYETNYGERIKIAEKYNNIMGAETKLLQAEIDKFLELYPNEYFNDYFHRRSQSAQGSEINNSPRKPEGTEGEKLDGTASSLPQELRKCQYQADALRNWKLGLREAIQFYRLVCHKEMDVSIKRWVERQCNSMKRDLEAKYALHHTRYHRIETEIRDVRLAELQSHEQRFLEHKLGVQRQLEDLQEHLDEYEGMLRERVEEFEKEADDMEEIGKKSENSVEISNLILKAENMTTKMNRIFETTLQNYLDETTNKMKWIQKSNLNYIKKLKLFSKGGNFHQDEVNFILGELEKLSEEVDNKGKNFRKQAADKQTGIIPKMKDISEKLLNGLKSGFEDVQFAEKVTLAIVSVRHYIKREVRHMKYNRKLLSLQLDQLLTELPSSGGVDLLSFIRQFWQPLMDGAEQYYTYLLQPTRSNYHTHKGGDTQSSKVGLRFIGFDSVSIGMTNNQPGGRRSNMEHSFKDYKELLFDNSDPPLSGSSFMENVCRCIWEVFLALQESAADYYKVKRTSPVSRTYSVRPTYEDFLEETLIRFKYYHLQCEEVWLEEVHEFLSLLNRMQNISNVFCDQAVEKFHSNRTGALSEAHKIFLEKMTRVERQHSDKREFLTEKLKPLHGYPGNIELLTNLEMEVKEANKAIREETKEHVIQYKGYLQQRETSYKSDIKTLGNRLQKVLDTIFTSPLIAKDLADQAEEVLRGINSRSFTPTRASSWKARSRVLSDIGENIRIKHRETTSGSNAQTGEETNICAAAAPEASTHKSSRSVMRTIEDIEEGDIPQDYRLSIDQNGESVVLDQDQKFSFPKSSTFGDIRVQEFEKSMGDSREVRSHSKRFEKLQIQPTDVASSVATAEKRFVNEIANFKKKASKFSSTCNEGTNKWFKEFKANKEKVKELYTVPDE